MKRYRDYRPAYLAAWTLFILLILLTAFGSLLTPHSVSPDQINHLLVDPETGKKIVPPLSPSSVYWFGTDVRGMDILSLLLNGMKYTLAIGLAITLIRFIVALPLGLWSGATGRLKSTLSSLQWGSTSLPPLLFMYPILITLYYALQIDKSPAEGSVTQIFFMTVFIVLVSLIGIFPIAKQIGDRAEYFHQHLFVTSSVLMGGKVRHRIVKHLLPNLRSEITFAFLTDFLQVLFLLGQLAVLGIFLSGTTIISNFDESIQIPTSATGEWFAIISYAVGRIRYEPWVFIGVGLFYVGTVAILQFFLTQLKKGPSLARQEPIR